ncbi:MAG: hypothetical protein KDK45_18525, partial [Leptospiraceae bacterium]|nr:hypothetical protein [Leptospiraceae bacterium]
MKPLYIRLLLLLILFFHISTIGAKDRKLESIYILPIRSSGIHKSLEAELQSILRIETIQLVSERFTILDEDLQRLSGERLAKKQSLGIDEEKDIHPLLKHIEPDYFLFSKLSMSNKSILFLNLRLIKNSGSSYVLQNELVLHFPENLKEFYMAQAIKKLFQKDYQTSEYSIIPIPEALALSFIPSEELWSLEVPNENTKISQILRILKEQEEKAYAAFQAKDYSLSLKHYSVLLNSIQEKLRTEEKNKILDYTNHLKQNFQIVYTYYLRARLDELDKNLQKGKSDKEDTLQSRLTSYSKLLEEYRMYSFYLNSLEIEKKLKDRVVYYKLLLYQKKEKLADTLYYHKNFLESLKAYLDIEQEIRQDKDLPPSYQNSIQKKITNVKKTATFFLKNGVRTYCDNAENINLKLQIQGSIGAEDKSRLEAELEESLVLAERRMKENQEFLTEDIREYYN